MTNKKSETDYLVIGGGAMSAAFVDALLSGDKKATVTIVERRDRLGGHWNNAYPYVTLHQPAIFYGVNSINFGNGSTDLSTLPEIYAYFAKVMARFKKSGRVTFLGGHNYLGDNKVAPIDKPDEVVEYTVNKRLVNGTYMGVEIPSCHPPKFEVEECIPFHPPNDLPELVGNWQNYYVLGCGKTGIDAVLYLLKNGVPQEKIHWVMSNDIWCFKRSEIQVGRVMDAVLEHVFAANKVDTPDDIFLEVEKNGGIIRLDPDVQPTKWKCATVNADEIEALQPVKNKIRFGRIKKLSKAGLEFSEEIVGYGEGAVFINCTADALAAKDPTPIFSEGRIDLQSVFFCQQVFSAAAIGRLETRRITDGMRNWIKPVPHPETAKEWTGLLSCTFDNVLKMHAFMPLWMMTSRLFYLSHEPRLMYLKYAVQAFFASHPLRRSAKRLSS